MVSYYKPTYRASKTSLNRAVDLLHKHVNRSKIEKVSEKRRRESDKKIRSHCTTSLLRSRDWSTATEFGFERSQAFDEMIECLIRHDWNELQKLLWLLLTFSRDRQCYLWRYAILLHLYSPQSTPSKLEDFIKFCISNDINEESTILQNLMTLPSKKSIDNEDEL